jgi:hypothetical protein
MSGDAAGFDGNAQIQIALKALAANGGSGTVAFLYRALEAEMHPHTLSGKGKAALRCFINRKASRLGFVEAERVARLAATWNITQKGREHAGLVSGPKAKKAPANATAKWLDQQLKFKKGEPERQLHRKMRITLSKRLPVSANTDQVEDHIQNFLLRMIRRDAFAKHLESGRCLPYSKVVAYCVNSGRTDARDMGKEPVCREMFGARTEKERRLRAADTADPAFGEPTAGEWDTDGNIVPPNDIPMTEEEAGDFDALWSRIETIVYDRKPQAWERYTGLLAMKAQGYTIREIAEHEGVSRNRAASMLAEARRHVRDGRADGDMAYLGF